MTHMQPRCYEHLLTHLDAQRQKLGLGLNQLDEICGWPSGMATKVFGPSRYSSIGVKKSLWLLLPELGLQMVIIEDAELLAKRRVPDRQYEKAQARFGNQSQTPGIHVMKRVLRHIGRIGGQNRMRSMSKKERTAHQVAAANARWKSKRQSRAGRVSV